MHLPLEEHTTAQARTEGKGAAKGGFSPLNTVLLLAAVFFVAFALLTLDTPLPTPLDPSEILVPEPFEQYNGVRRNYGESTTKTGDLVTNYPSGNLLCLATSIGCTSSAAIGGSPAQGAGEALLNPVALLPGASGTTPVLLPTPTSAPPTTNAPRLEFSDAVNRKDADGKICAGLSREEAARFLCDRGIANRFFDDDFYYKYCLNDVSREFCDTWNECVRNINLKHFSKSYSDSTILDTFTGRVLGKDGDGKPIVQNLYETLPDGRRVGICEAFPPSAQ